MDFRSTQLTDAILEIGAGQNGTISRRQLLEAGLDEGSIERRNKTGLLFRIYRGAYSTAGGRVNQKAIWMAGVLAAGGHSLLSHMSSIEGWGIGPSGTTEVTRPSGRGRRGPTGEEAYRQARGQAVQSNGARIPALSIHETRRLDPSEVTVRFGIPITTVARTFVDVSGAVGIKRLKTLLHEAGRLGLLDFEEIRCVMDRSRGKKGVAKLRQILEDWDPQTALTRNRLETLMLSLCRKYGLPIPQVNRWVAGYEVDFFWPYCGLVVETDGGQDHALPFGLERDRNKDSDLKLAGFEVLRLTWAMLKHEPDRSMGKVRAHLKLCEKRNQGQVPSFRLQPAGEMTAPHG